MKSSQMSVNVSLAADDAKNHDGEGELGFDRSLLRAPADPAIVSPVDLLILVEVLLIGEKTQHPDSFVLQIVQQSSSFDGTTLHDGFSQQVGRSQRE